VFVTLRDNLDGGFASEGVVDIKDHAPFAARRKPSFAAVRRLVDRWDGLLAARAEQRLAEESARREEAYVAEWRARATFYRAVTRGAQAKLASVRLRYWSARRQRARIRLRRQIERAALKVRELRSHTGWARAAADDFARRAALYEAHAAERGAFVAGG
jgi:hypothetical protein